MAVRQLDLEAGGVGGPPPAADTRARPALRAVAGVLLFGVAYYALGRYSLEFTTFAPNAPAIFWAPAGLVLAVLVTVPRRRWPWFLAMLGVANVAGNLAVGATAAAGAGFAVADVVEGVAAAEVTLRLAGGRRLLATLRGTGALIVGATMTVLGGLVGAALLGRAAMPTFGTDFWDVWRSYTVGDFAGVLVSAPLALTVLDLPRRARGSHRPGAARAAELAAVLAALAASALVAFGGRMETGSILASMPYLTIIPLAWAAVRFSPRVTAAACSLLSFAVVWLTTAGRGAFAIGDATPEARITVLHGFLAVVICSMLVLAAVVEERRGLTRDLDDRIRDIEAARGALAAGERELRERNDALELAVEGIALTDPAGRYRFANPAFGDVVGRPGTDLRGRDWWEPFHADDHATLQHALGRAESAGKATADVRAGRPAGDPAHVELTLVPASRPHDAGGGGTYVLARDVTERHRYEDELARRALHDELTGLANRRLLQDRLELALRRLGRGRGVVAVLFVDLDRFKIVNDSMGHSYGDELLVGVSERLASALRPADTLARFGGDEFVIVVETADRAGTAAVLARVQDALRCPFLVRGIEVFVTASIGVACAEGEEVGPDDLLRRADVAMYQAKDAGRDRHEVFHESLQAKMDRRLDNENTLRRAVERDELRAFYQPIAELPGGCIVRCEALLRWERPGHPFENRAWFVPMAEESDLIVTLGDWILRRACADVVELNRGRPATEALRMHVNVASAQLILPGLPATVEAALAHAGCEPDRLTLEITETVLVRDVETCLQSLGRLRDMGVGLCIDDFGTGYSSLSYLHRFPVDTIKIGLPFVHGLGSATVRSIVTSVVNLAHDLGVVVVAEGIETPLQRSVVEDVGCDLGQGFLLGRPAPLDRLCPPAGYREATSRFWGEPRTS